jgi:diguanylate cyclase (GGDEF)-like protein/putative nucleotidyltransferase with HDIG domain
MARRTTSDPADALALRFRLRTLRIGMWPSLFTCAYFALYNALTWERPHRDALLALCAVAAVSAVALPTAPVERLVRGRWREPFFVGWSASLVAIITAGAAIDGGVTSPLALAFFLPLAYAALSYPLGSMVVVAALDVAAFVVLAIAQGGALPLVVVFVGSLVCAAWMCAWQARNLETHRRELSRVSRADPLTGCLNRRGFEERFAAELGGAQRHARPLALVVLDLDHFKQVNDTGGHAAGDRLLQWVVATLREALRAGDVVGRLGGDEFAVLVDQDRAGATAIVDRLLRALAARTQASAGIAVFPFDATTADGLQQAADAELYDRKRRRAAHPGVEARQLSWAAALASAVDERMAVAHQHSHAVADYAAAIASRLGWSEPQVGLVRLAAMLHDVGKVRVPEHILRKPGPLTAEEHAVMTQHAAAGAEIVGRVEGLQAVAAWIRHSHERLDGAGYPDGLAGPAIPDASRILLVADAYDALTSDRAYRRARPAPEAVDELRRHAGSQFDPECVELLVRELADRGALAAAEPAAVPG